MLAITARQELNRVYGTAATLVAAAPGRVNLIGEHTDYNDGYVLPMAIDRAVVMAAVPRDDQQVRLWSVNFGQEAEFSLHEITRDSQASWSNYVRGIAWVLQKAGYPLRGMDAVIVGDVPIGAGLSSSAAIETVAAYIFERLSGFSLTGPERARLCQQAENEFVGMRCGIMDQFVASLGQRDHALFIDCRDLHFRHVPLPEGVAIAVCDTHVSRDLVSSAYNTRRAECEQGAQLLGVRALRDVSLRTFQEKERGLPEPIRRRCRHVISENERVLRAMEALERGDVQTAGALINESHESLRDDYEVSCKELDVMVAAARAVEGVYGARMTGAGFGGCTVNLVAAEAVEAFRRRVAATYREVTGIEASIYVCMATDGVRELG
ncbi:MAG: galactokinase [Chloroflexi bacterium]|nr:galactokinase [Chloroflexota bacterium]